MQTREPDWLNWARELQAIAQTGLTFTQDPYDRERYEALRALSARIFETHTHTPGERILGLFRHESGYATPKLEVRAAVFDQADRLLLVRETADAGRWALPGGWADVNLTPAENVVKEVREESGYEVAVRKLAAAWDRARQGHPHGLFSCCKLFFICELTGVKRSPGLKPRKLPGLRRLISLRIYPWAAYCLTRSGACSHIPGIPTFPRIMTDPGLQNQHVSGGMSLMCKLQMPGGDANGSAIRKASWILEHARNGVHVAFILYFINLGEAWNAGFGQGHRGRRQAAG